MLQDALRSLGLTRRVTPSERRLQLVVLFVGLGLVVGVTIAWLSSADLSDAEYWKTLGYPGVFVVSFVGAAGLVLPVPGLAAVCGAAGLELNLIVVGVLAGVAETAGELSGYAIGYGGRRVVEHRRLYRTATRWMERRGTLVLFVLSAVPNPVFDVVGITAGSTRYPIKRFLLVVGAGKLIKSLAVAWACNLGVNLLPWEL